MERECLRFMRWGVLVMLFTTSMGVAIASTSNLTVKGVITPAACSFSVANGGVIDYQVINGLDIPVYRDLKTTRKILPGAVQVHCSGPAQFSLTMMDNRQSSAGGNLDSTDVIHDAMMAEMSIGAGLGFDGTENKIGGYVLAIGNPRIDGVPVLLGNTGIEGKLGDGWAKGGSASASERTYRLLDQDWDPVAGRHLVMDLGIAVNIAPASRLDLSRPIHLNGSHLFQINYL